MEHRKKSDGKRNERESEGREKMERREKER